MLKKLLFDFDGIKIPSILLFLMLYLGSSYVICNEVYSSILTYVIFILIFTILFLYHSKKKNHSDSTFFLILLFLLMLITTYLNNDDFRRELLVIASLFLSFVFVKKIDIDVFLRSYVQLMTLVCGVSLLLFFAYLLIPPLSSINVITSTKQPVSSLFIFVKLLNSDRNCGFFWEPGAFQAFINMALLFELLKSNPDMKKVYLFVATVATTFSTTGYLCVITIFLWYFSRGGKMKKNMMLLLGLVIVGAALIYFASDSLFSTSGSTTFGKLQKAQETGFTDNTGTTVSIRYYSFVKPIEVFLDNPLFGVSYQGLKDMLYFYTENMNTCTFVNYLAVYGVFFSIVIFVGYFRFSNQISKRKYDTIAVVFILFLITCSENFIHNLFLYIPIYYGLSRLKRRIHIL